MDMKLFDNIAWNCLAGPHLRYSSGTRDARRYAPGFSPILGFASTERPHFAALAPCCEPGEQFVCAGWSGAVPSGWRLHADATMHQMVWDAPIPAADGTLAAVPLGSEHTAQVLELVALTKPGPFGPRNGELGDYLGVFETGRLVAMAGERMEVGAFKEISGVCTHPDFQGRGLARRLVERLVGLEMRRDQTPFLHVRHDNVNARRLYERMGFRNHREVPVRVVSREQ